MHTCVLLQTNVIDFIAISLGMVATLRSANPVLFRDFGRCCLSHPRNYIQVFQTVLVTALMYITVTHLLSHESWFKVEKGTHSQVLLLLRCVLQSAVKGMTVSSLSACGLLLQTRPALVHMRSTVVPPTPLKGPADSPCGNLYYKRQGKTQISWLLCEPAMV